MDRRMAGNETGYDIRRKRIVTRLEPASFEVERFELADNACLELRGRWSGVRGRRFMRPALISVADGREQRILAVLDHKPWNAEDGETWLAAFPCPEDPAALAEAELTVAPGVTVPLPPPTARGAGRRRPRAATRRSGPRQGDRKLAEDASEGGRVENRGDSHDRLTLEQEAVLRSSDEAAAELDAAKQECERLRGQHRQALEARDQAIAARQESIEAEVRVRIEDLRAEAERERAGARLAAQTARERDEARSGRDEAARERDEARAEREHAQRARNRMLAERDTARSSIEEVTRQWELTAGLGTRRTLERDALAIECERLARDRDDALAKGDSIALERQAALAECERNARERDAAMAERDTVARERDTALAKCERIARERDAALQDREGTLRERDTAPAPPQAEIDKPTLVLSERALLESQIAPVAAQAAPLRPRVRQARLGREALETGAMPAAPEAPPGRPQDEAEMWRTRLLALSALLVAVIILGVLLLTQ
jgi:hypothetical protein